MEELFLNNTGTTVFLEPHTWLGVPVQSQHVIRVPPYSGAAVPKLAWSDFWRISITPRDWPNSQIGIFNPHGPFGILDLSYEISRSEDGSRLSLDYRIGQITREIAGRVMDNF